MSAPHDLDRELHHHAVALRRIARDLLRDPHVADDVTQDTLHRALAHRDLRPGPLGGWLYRTLVNFANQWRRGERRRLARETQHSRPEPVEAPPDTLSRRETLTAVTNAVLALDEPYQTAIFLRYFEDLPPRAIARRTATNLATVKSRLQRGLVMLRARLDRQCGRDQRDWRLALLTTFGLPATTVAAGLTLTTGAWLVGTTTKTLIAAGLLCAGGLFAYGFTQDPPPQRADSTVPAAATTADPATSSADGKQETTQREDVPVAEVVAPWLDHPFLFELEALVVDPTGLPVEGRTLRLAPPGCTLNDAPKATGPDGRVTLSWRSRLASGEIVLADERGTLRRIALQHGTKASLTLLGKAPGSRQGLWLSSVLVRGGKQTLDRVPLSLSGDLVLASGDASNALRSGLHPHAVFATAGAKIEVLAEEEGTRTNVVAWNKALGRRITLDMNVEGKPSAATAPLARIAGTVFGEDGKPAAKLPVALLGTGPQPLQRTETDESGQFAFENVLAAEHTVRAGGTAAGLATIPVVTTTGTTPTTLNLRRDSCVRGRAVTATGQPLAKATIGWRATDGSWCDSTESAEDGTFVLANLPGSAGTVFLWEPTGNHPLPVAMAENVLCDTNNLLMRFDPAAASTLRLDPVLPEGVAGAALQVRVWNLDTGFGTKMPQPEANQPWRLVHLPAGWYRVELHTAATGWFDAGRHWVDGKADCDLGRVQLPAPGTATFAIDANGLPAADQQAFEVYAIRRDVDVRVEASGFAPEGGLLLPAGDYALAWKSKNGAVLFHRFTAQSGKELAIRPGH